MEFDYFHNLTPLPDPVLNLEGPFSYNGTTYDALDVSAGDNFTFLISYEKKSASGQIMLSYYSNGTGWVLGWDHGNFLYIDSIASNVNHTFRKVNLANKECLAIKRSDKTFSVHSIDLQSNTIRASESFSFPPSARLDAGYDFLFGGADFYTGSLVNNSIRFFSGIVDQYSLFNIAMDNTYLLQILSGYKPYTLSSITGTSFSLLQEAYRFPETTSLQSNYTFLASYISGVNSGIVNNLGTGNWLSNSTGYFNTASISGTGYFSTGLNACYGTGSFYAFSRTGSGGPVSSTTNFSDTIRVNRSSGLATVTHNFTLNGTGYYTGNFHVDHDAIYSVATGITSSLVLNPDYYTGFKMNGVISENTSRIALASNTGIAPSGYNIQGLYDQAFQQFNLPGFTGGNLFYTGQPYYSNYSISGNYLTLTGVTQADTHYVVADNISGSTFLNSGVTNWATGNFYPTAAQVFSGQYNTGRMKNTDYRETATSHLYHASPIQGSGTQFLFDI